MASMQLIVSVWVLFGAASASSERAGTGGTPHDVLVRTMSRLARWDWE